MDDGNLLLQYNRHRYYDYYTGRWTTQDPLGITPNAQKPNVFGVLSQYTDGLSLYEYVRSKPVGRLDPDGYSFGITPIEVGIGEEELEDLEEALRGLRRSMIILSLQKVCDKYDFKKCCEVDVCYTEEQKGQCKGEATILGDRYYTKFSAWAQANPGYHACVRLSTVIFGMNLDAGLEWFDLKEMVTASLGYVGVFHQCNPDFDVGVGSARKATSDVRLDPWVNPYWFAINPLLNYLPLEPAVLGGLTGIVLQD